MGTLVDVGAGAKLRGLFQQLEERIPEEALRPTVMAMAEDAAKRAPNPQQEYQTMMYGGYNASDFNVSRNKLTDRIPGLQGAIMDADNRVRFYKANELYLKNFIPTSFGIDGLTAWVGDVLGLNAASAYTYVNYGSPILHASRSSGETFQHEVNYPFWEAWEHGGIFTIKPNNYGFPYYLKGFPYSHYLKPAEGVRALQMTKIIPALNMYGAVDTQVFVNKILVPNIRKIVRSI